MKLWILRPIENAEENRWEPWYDKAFGFVVRAETEEEARQAVLKEAGDEGKSSWTDPKYSTCEELIPDGEPGIVMRDFAAA